MKNWAKNSTHQDTGPATNAIDAGLSWALLAWSLDLHQKPLAVVIVGPFPEVHTRLKTLTITLGSSTVHALKIQKNLTRQCLEGGSVL